MAALLAPELYDRLCHVFDDVRIHDPGQPPVIHPVLRQEYVNGFLQDVLINRISNSGEAYVVCCPYCNTRSPKLYVSHSWGIEDDSRTRFWSYLHCMKSGCYGGNDLSLARTRAEILWDQVWGPYAEPNRLLARPAVIVGREPPKPIREIRNVNFKLLTSLPADHPACVYIRSRGFDVATITKKYGVWYCVDAKQEVLQDRIIFPLYWGGEFYNFQGRLLRDPEEGESKYITMPGVPKSGLFYNIDDALRYQDIAIVEGTIDCWSTGPWSVATWGISISDDQIDLLMRLWPQGRFIVLYDGPAHEIEAEQRRRSVAKLKNRLANRVLDVEMPSGSDPDKLDPAQLAYYVERAAALAGWETPIRWQPTAAA
jgi:hypothetical protein